MPTNDCYPAEEIDYFFFLKHYKRDKNWHIIESWKSPGKGSGNNAMSAGFEILVTIEITGGDTWPASSHTPGI